eukprot:CAMPEP_0168462122 /NCGR_PEP_ID=MMETSP0228-20121227/54356_1 /TAXON_ID=133427 /ORGANISM="Protoceratium reticulatum, Strain CCCM 535 (=CCMP 1889)" /LENGTH=72 /DNA_ID=CAMNT_0008477495 /DNA_START=7 /DNA_END=221 /DNA_ORIENTATION=-
MTGGQSGRTSGDESGAASEASSDLDDAMSSTSSSVRRLPPASEPTASDFVGDAALLGIPDLRASSPAYAQAL